MDPNSLSLDDLVEGTCYMFMSNGGEQIAIGAFYRKDAGEGVWLKNWFWYDNNRYRFDKGKGLLRTDKLTKIATCSKQEREGTISLVTKIRVNG